MKQIEGNIVDVQKRQVFPGVIWIENGKISRITKNTNRYDVFIAPGFIDAHVHIESSMLIPAEFSKLVIRRGTVAVINDPHEIANVLGVPGIEYMIANSSHSKIKTFFTIPSCVPATSFDSAGSEINSQDVELLVESNRFIGLSEMMNVPGVIDHDPEVMAKIEFARKKGLVIDGHAPGLSGDQLKYYIDAGISTDHECSSLDEALEKIRLGMKILIREGSAAKNYDALKSLIASHPDHVMFCTDDSHPGDLLRQGHIDKIVRRAIAEGFDLFNTLKIASVNPVRHYGLDVGMLQIGNPADFTIFEDLTNFNVLSVYIDGKEEYNSTDFCSNLNPKPVEAWNLSAHGIILNDFNRDRIDYSDLKKSVENEIICIKVLNDEIVTEKILFPLLKSLDNLESDIDRDILKIVYLNRYGNKLPQMAFIHGIGLRKGAFATSISHDSHNIIAVGCNDHDLTIAINMIIREKGGLTVVSGADTMILPLPIAGIMTDKTGEEIADIWECLIGKLKEMGCMLDSPFMTLSFMSLIVIPELKIGEYGLFEFSKFAFIEN